MLSNGYAYSLDTPVGDEGWTSQPNAVGGSSTCPSGSLTTFTFICNASATTTAATQQSARVFSDPTQCMYIVQLQTSVACQGSSAFLPSPTSASQFGGLGYDLGALTGYDIFSAESGNYNGQFSSLSFCATIFNGSTSTAWAYSARAAGSVSFTAGSVTAPSGNVVISQLFGSVLSSANGNPDVPFQLTSQDGGDNLLILTAGSTAAYPNGGGFTLSWNLPSGDNVFANLYQGSTYVVDSAGASWNSGSYFTITAQYYDPANPQLIACNTQSALIASSTPYNPTTLPSQTTVVPYYYYIHLAGVVQDPTCQQYAPGSMVCQRWVPNVCTDTEVASVWQPTVVSPSWTYINGANWTGGIQLSTLVAPPVALTHTGVSQLSCVGTVVRLQFQCSPTTLRPYIASSYRGVSASNACAFTFIIPTYLVCTAPGAPSLPAPVPTVTGCTPSVGGVTYNLAPLGLYDISAYDANGVQYVYRPCGVVANAFAQSTAATVNSQLVAIPQVCSQPSATINVTTIAGAYSSSTATWAALPNSAGVQLTQSTGATCVATCGGSVVYSGPWQSVVQFVCANNAVNVSSSQTAAVGAYNSQCQPVNGGACTLTFTAYTTNACSASSAFAVPRGSCGVSALGTTFDFSSLSSSDIYGTDGSAGSNEDNYYVARICGSVSDAACLAAAGSAGSMVCQHGFPYYQQNPNAGSLSSPTSALCSQNLTSLIPAYSVSAQSTSWALVDPANVTAGVTMTVTSSTGCPTTNAAVGGGGPATVRITFMCAPLQTAPVSFAAVVGGSCSYNLTLYTSLACTAAQLAAPAVTAVTPPPAATAATCGFNGVSFASLAVDINATDETGRTYVVHPCGAVSSVSTQYCSFPNNAQQLPSQYPSACEVTGYCNPSVEHNNTQQHDTHTHTAHTQHHTNTHTHTHSGHTTYTMRATQHGLAGTDLPLHLHLCSVSACQLLRHRLVRLLPACPR